MAAWTALANALASALSGALRELARPLLRVVLVLLLAPGVSASSRSTALGSDSWESGGHPSDARPAGLRELGREGLPSLAASTSSEGSEPVEEEDGDDGDDEATGAAPQRLAHGARRVSRARARATARTPSQRLGGMRHARAPPAARA